MNAQKITQTFDGQISWVIAGGYFKLLSAQYPVTVDLFREGRKVLSAPLMEAGFYQRGLFDRVEITTPVNEEISFLVAPDEGGSDRLAGEVSVIDGSAGIVKSERGFYGYGSQGAVAGQYSHVQLFSLAANNKNIFVRRVTGYIEIAGGAALTLGYYDTALGFYRYPLNKKSGAAASANKINIGANAGWLGGPTLAGSPVEAAFVKGTCEFEQPIELPPGTGLVMAPDVVNAKLCASFDFYEEDAL